MPEGLKEDLETNTKKPGVETPQEVFSEFHGPEIVDMSVVHSEFHGKEDRATRGDADKLNEVREDLFAADRNVPSMSALAEEDRWKALSQEERDEKLTQNARRMHDKAMDDMAFMEGRRQKAQEEKLRKEEEGKLSFKLKKLLSFDLFSFFK
jgi:hypothetical protein